MTACFTHRTGKLRRQKSAASAIQVFLHTNRHRPDRPQYFPMAGHELLVPTAFTPELIGEAVRVLERIYREGFQYTKAGILCLGLVPDEERQESLFRPVDRETVAKQKRLMATADQLNLWYGRGTVRPATMGTHQPWQMRQGRLSPRYTTRLSDLPPAHLQ